MYIINAKTSKNELIYLAIIDEFPIWTIDVTRIKIFNTVNDAAKFLNSLSTDSIVFENYNLAMSTSIKISQLIIKEMY